MAAGGNALCKDFDNFVFDCDGVLWHGSAAIPGAADALRALEARGKRLYFVTNNSGAPRPVLGEKIQRLLGLQQVDPERQIVTAASSMGQYLKDEAVAGRRVPKALVLASSNVAAEVAAAGVEVVTMDPATEALPYDLSAAEKLPVDPAIKAVVVGYYAQLSMHSIALGCLCLLENPGCQLLATNLDKQYNATGGRRMPAAGAHVAAMATGSGKVPIVCGKPQGFSLQRLLELEGLAPERTLMVGDMPTDIAFAHAVPSVRGALVLSGVSTSDEVRGWQGTDQQPDYVLADVGGLLSGAAAAAAAGVSVGARL